MNRFSRVCSQRNWNGNDGYTCRGLVCQPAAKPGNDVQRPDDVRHECAAEGYPERGLAEPPRFLIQGCHPGTKTAETRKGDASSLAELYTPKLHRIFKGVLVLQRRGDAIAGLTVATR